MRRRGIWRQEYCGWKVGREEWGKEVVVKEEEEGNGAGGGVTAVLVLGKGPRLQLQKHVVQQQHRTGLPHEFRHHHVPQPHWYYYCYYNDDDDDDGYYSTARARHNSSPSHSSFKLRLKNFEFDEQKEILIGSLFPFCFYYYYYYYVWLIVSRQLSLLTMSEQTYPFLQSHRLRLLSTAKLVFPSLLNFPYKTYCIDLQ
uniref:Uncharacterized protein n=1 Tax=Physcomitrium patens TaxID=3218 RepID=A0A2K1IXB8_PHYPA|nr:hypothetical protein PHYPA_023730 [Physcomitrium patens]